MVEWCHNGLDDAAVVDEATVLADEEVAVLGDVEVIHRLDLVGLNGLNSGGPSDKSYPNR